MSVWMETGQKVHCLAPCATSRLCAVFRDGERFRFGRGDQLWRQGAHADQLMIVCSGLVQLTRSGDTGPVFLSSAVRGDLVGVEMVTGDRSYDSTCSAVVSGQGIKVCYQQVAAKLEHHPWLTMELVRTSLDRASRMARRLQQLNSLTVRGRIATILLDLGGAAGHDDARGIFVPLRLSRVDLAGMAACRPETATRVMVDLERRDIVQMQPEGFVIADHTRLRSEQAAR